MFASQILNTSPWKLFKGTPWSEEKEQPKSKKSPQFLDLPLGYPKDFARKKAPAFVEDDVPEEIQEARETIIDFFTEQSQTSSIDSLIELFDVFFIKHEPGKIPQELNHSIYQLLVFNCRSDFVYLLNRCAFLILATGLKQQQMGHIKQLLALFKEQPELPHNASLATRQFREWGNSYKTTRQYNLLTKFAPHVVSEDRPWSERYLRFPLLANGFEEGISPEESYACEFLYKLLENRYKFQLVMFVTKGHDASESEPASTNPTLLSPATLKLIRKIILNDGQSFATATDELLQRTEKTSFAEFKTAFAEYICASMVGDRRLKWLPPKIEKYLAELNPEKDDVEVGPHLIKKTCNNLISYLLNPESFADPTHPFTLLMIQREFLSLSLILLKLLLISPKSYGQVVICLNALINEHNEKSEEDCQWLIGLLETVQAILTLAIDSNKSSSLTSAV